MALSPLPLLFAFLGGNTDFPEPWRLISASLAAMACFSCALILFRYPMPGKVLGGAAALGSFAAAIPYLARNPFAALSGAVALICIAFSLVDFRITARAGIKSDHAGRCLQRAWWAASAVPVVVAIDLVIGTSGTAFAAYVISVSSIVAQVLYLHWSAAVKSRRRLLLPVGGMASIAVPLCLSSSKNISVIAVLVSLVSLMSMHEKIVTADKNEYGWEFLLTHPARILLTTFLALCAVGTFLLIVPASTKTGAIDLIDAVFTSVSAVCVTGLVVLDTPKDFTLFGQFSILLLIQLGGLGIMSITTVALHAMGRRLSLKHERLLTSMTDTTHKDLVHSLATILKFTFAAEGAGALLLALLFLSAGDRFPQALWRGTFTAISAFCNAGFALQSDSLIPYQTHPMILHVVSMLIIFGGMAPATSLIVPRWLAGRPVPIPAAIALVTTALLLFTGTFFIMAFEWNGVLDGLSAGDKIHNAWFQSVTLRTAGFNSVDIATVANPTFLIMIFLMFIGGSPGGTAGGVKTAAVGVLAMTFWSIISNRSEVITRNRRIHPITIYRAITIVASGIVVWFCVVLMLEVTQQISSRDLIFEVTSALGTVGLSTGATSLLDEIGKIIIIIAMFAGRLGPMTLFTLLGEEQTASESNYPIENISIT